MRWQTVPGQQGGRPGSQKIVLHAGGGVVVVVVVGAAVVVVFGAAVVVVVVAAVPAHSLGGRQRELPLP